VLSDVVELVLILLSSFWKFRQETRYTKGFSDFVISKELSRVEKP
jgi:hypothetical protein